MLRVMESPITSVCGVPLPRVPLPTCCRGETGGAYLETSLTLGLPVGDVAPVASKVTSIFSPSSDWTRLSNRVNLSSKVTHVDNVNESETL